MRILYITPDYAQGALYSLTGHVTHALSRLAQREGHTVSVANLGAAAGFATQWLRGVAVTAVPDLRIPSNLGPFTNWLQEQPVDVVHAVLAQPSDLPLRPTLPAPLLATLTGLPSGPAECIQAWLAQARLRTVLTPLGQVQWASLYPGQVFKVLPHGVDLLALLRHAAAGAIPAQDAPPTVLVPADASGVREELAILRTLEQAGRVRLVAALAPLISLVSAPPGVDAVLLPSERPGTFSLVEQECAALTLHCLHTATTARDGLAAWSAALETWLVSFRRSTTRGLHAAMPMRIEEEAFYFDSLYRQIIAGH